MSEKQLEQLLSAISDLQVSVDALGLDLEELRKGARKSPSRQDVAPPGWIRGQADVLIEVLGPVLCYDDEEE